MKPQKKVRNWFLFGVMLIVVLNFVDAIDVGNGVGVNIQPVKLAPKVWLCENRSFNNYVVENEVIKWKILIFDKYDINRLGNVIGLVINEDNKNIELNCIPDANSNSLGILDPSCNAKFSDFIINEFGKDSMIYYTCSLTAENYNKMNGKYILSFEATNAVGISERNLGVEYLFITPIPSIHINFNSTNNDIDVKTDLDYYIRDYSEKCLDKYCNKKIKKYFISNDKQDAYLELKYIKSRNNGQIEIINLSYNGVKQPIKRNSFKIMNSTRGISERLIVDKISLNLDYNKRKDETMVKSYGARKVLTTKGNGLSLIQLNIINGNFNYSIIRDTL
ncbi:MAG: hypothetical protein WC867_07040 [Candidatus Pacearchaeota archaeon]|jgi:hypothetical protein